MRKETIEKANNLLMQIKENNDQLKVAELMMHGNVKPRKCTIKVYLGGNCDEVELPSDLFKTVATLLTSHYKTKSLFLQTEFDEL